MKKNTVTRFALADDDPHFRQLLIAEVCQSKDWKLIYSCCNADDLLQHFQKKVEEEESPEVVILDLYMPGISTIELIDQLRQKKTNLRFLVYSTIYQPHIHQLLEQLQVNAYCEKQFCVITNALRELRRCANCMNRSYFEEWRNKKLDWNESPYSNETIANLSARELHIIMQLCKGKSNHAIAESLYLSERTIENNLNSLLKKFNLHRRAELIDLAYHYGVSKLYKNTGQTFGTIEQENDNMVIQKRPTPAAMYL